MATTVVVNVTTSATCCHNEKDTNFQRLSYGKRTRMPMYVDSVCVCVCGVGAPHLHVM